MGDIIAVNTVRLGNDAEDVEMCIKNINKKISEMKSSVSDLDSMWDGPASDAFKKAFQSDMKAMESVVEGLNDLKKYEDQAKSKYEACENEVAALVSEIKI